ncbi:hypothetical protein P5V32_25390 [Mycobacteroides abscessus subsp. bolletii]|nr:hypothetical protein [Mycobacteroides abscessus]MDO2968605.1 hypothetical protein [Mycobacteroides abscessus subsp. bolletii]MDO3081130.1 hypothetical protein [Mycobacteroides abscessus subsp. bolletii]
MVMSDRWRMSPGLRRTSAVVAIAALAIGSAKIASDHTMPGSGFSTVATVAADPTGPTGGPGGGPGGMNGSQFQPPGLPPQMPDYQGGINQPPLDQNSGISIYNTGSPGAQQVPGQQGAQQPQQSWDQPAHGTQIPDYSTAPGYTQGPGKPNPDYQAPQQGNQAQQPQQGQQQQPSQAPTQTQQPSQNDQQDQQDRELKQQCQQQAEYYGIAEQMASFIASSIGGFGSMFGQPSRNWGPAFECNCAPEQKQPEKAPNSTDDKPVCDPSNSTTVTPELLKKVFPNISDSNASKFSDQINKAAKEFNINKNAKRVSAFLAQMRGEVGSDFAYGQWLEQATDGSAPGTDAEREFFARKYANWPYSDNGDYASGDGFRFRGRGPLQITHRHNVTLAFKYFKLPDVFMEHPDALSDIANPEFAFRAAAWFFTDSDGADPSETLHHFDENGPGPTPQNVNGNILADGIDPNNYVPGVDSITSGVIGPAYDPKAYAVRSDAFKIAYDELTKGCVS